MRLQLNRLAGLAPGHRTSLLRGGLARRGMAGIEVRRSDFSKGCRGLDQQPEHRFTQLRHHRSGGAGHRRVERHRPAFRRGIWRLPAPRWRSRPAASTGSAELAARDRAAGRQCLPVACDVTDRDSIAAAIATAEEQLGPLSILVNNAGVVVSKPLFEHTEEDWDYVVDTNLKGAWLMAREFAQHLVDRQRPGRIINISSMLGFRTIGRVPAYCAAKAGLIHLTQVLAMELARYGILVNALAPGYIETDFNRAFFQTEAGKTLIGRIPLKRIGQAPRSRRRDAVPGLAGQRLRDRRGDRRRWRPRRRGDLIPAEPTCSRALPGGGRAARAQRRDHRARTDARAARSRRIGRFDAGFLGGPFAGEQRLVLRTDAPTGVPASLGRIEEFAVLKAVHSRPASRSRSRFLPAPIPR